MNITQKTCVLSLNDDIPIGYSVTLKKIYDCMKIGVEKMWYEEKKTGLYVRRGKSLDNFLAYKMFMSSIFVFL